MGGCEGEVVTGSESDSLCRVDVVPSALAAWRGAHRVGFASYLVSGVSGGSEVCRLLGGAFSDSLCERSFVHKLGVGGVESFSGSLDVLLGGWGFVVEVS
ncbi:MAG: hypothetical protein OD811_06805, partial [Alphaproteobacteria bacterium]